MIIEVGLHREAREIRSQFPLL